MLLALLLSPLALAIPRLAGDRGSPGASVGKSDRPVPAARPGNERGGGAEVGRRAGEGRGTAAFGVPDLLDRPVLGFTINAHHIRRLDTYLRAVDSIAEMGANTLLVVTPMYQEKIDSTEIRLVPSKCPSDEQLVGILRRARAGGLQTILMPIVLIENPDEKEWRGVIEPKSWDRWWESYESFIDRFLSIAQRAPVDVLSIGSELNTTEGQVQRWSGIARRVRERFDGLITYSANWDHYEEVAFWPQVDIISVSSYFELEREHPGAPEEALVSAWAPISEALSRHAQRWKRPLMLSEVGYPSLPWANAQPWNYVATAGVAADHEAQARCWRAFFRAWSAPIVDRASPIIGFCGYRWDPYHQGGPGDTGYGVRGKPAMAVIRRGWREIDAMSRPVPDP